ncbi:MAG: TRAP transporter substrate-binding protein, partial [Rhodospirillales bacterium]|nr:TRAP transporter substrate-binding protein [Rhodospirillales bacterium]
AMQDAVTDAVTFQRGMAEREAVDARQAIEDEGCEVVELTAEEHQQFVDAVKPQHDEAREQFGDTMFEMLKEA